MLRSPGLSIGGALKVLYETCCCSGRSVTYAPRKRNATALVSVLNADLESAVTESDCSDGPLSAGPVTRAGVHVLSAQSTKADDVESGFLEGVYPSDNGLVSSGSGRATKKRRHGRAIRRAHRFARLTRALSVAIPVFAYI
jgi:hypothetical protein